MGPMRSHGAPRSVWALRGASKAHTERLRGWSPLTNKIVGFTLLKRTILISESIQSCMCVFWTHMGPMRSHAVPCSVWALRGASKAHTERLRGWSPLTNKIVGATLLKRTILISESIQT